MAVSLFSGKLMGIAHRRPVARDRSSGRAGMKLAR
jgi:hypothetical protein